MASIDKRPDGRYRARWREYPGGPQKTKSFARKLDAERFLVDVQHRLMSGTYVPPEAARVTVEEYYGRWLARMTPTWRQATLSAVQQSFRHILPVLGGRPLASVRRSDVEALCAALPLAPSTVALARQHLGQLFNAAVDDDLVVRNPARRARLPRRDAGKAQPVPLDVVAAIEAALPEWMAVVVPLGVGAGLRQGETSGLPASRVQFLRRTLRVDQQIVRGELAPPKTESSTRTIPLAGFVVDALAAHLSRFPAGSDELVVRDPAGRALAAQRFSYHWAKACRAAGAPGIRYHQLRHTFASTLLSRGVSVKAVAGWLGHASAVTTLNTYAHLMPADEDVARTVLDDVFSSAEDLVRTALGPDSR